MANTTLQNFIISLNRDFYDTFILSSGLKVPAKQFDFKVIDGKVIKKPPTESIKEFNIRMSTWLEQLKKIPLYSSAPKEFTSRYDWPFKEDLLLNISVGLTKKDYDIKDTDNMAKTIIDSMKGTVYEDDVRIVSFAIHKFIDNSRPLIIGIKKLKTNSLAVSIPPLFTKKSLYE